MSMSFGGRPSCSERHMIWLRIESIYGASVSRVPTVIHRLTLSAARYVPRVPTKKRVQKGEEWHEKKRQTGRQSRWFSTSAQW